MAMDIKKAEQILGMFEREVLVKLCRKHDLSPPSNASPNQIAHFICSAHPKLATHISEHVTRLELKLVRDELKEIVQMSEKEHVRQSSDEAGRVLRAADDARKEIESQARILEQKIEVSRGLNTQFEFVKWALVLFGLVAGFFGYTSREKIDEQVAEVSKLKTATQEHLLQTRTNADGLITSIQNRQTRSEHGLRTFEILRLVDSCKSIGERVSSNVSKDVRAQIEAIVDNDSKLLVPLEKTFSTNDESRLETADREMVVRLKNFYGAISNVTEILSSGSVISNAVTLQKIDNVFAAWEENKPSATLEEAAYYSSYAKRLSACRLNVLGILALKKHYAKVGETNLVYAETLFNKALESDSDFSRCHNSLGVIALARFRQARREGKPSLELIEQLNNAESRFDAALRRSPDQMSLSIIYNNLSTVSYLRAELLMGQPLQRNHALKLLSKAKRFSDFANAAASPHPVILSTEAELLCIEIMYEGTNGMAPETVSDERLEEVLAVLKKAKEKDYKFKPIEELFADTPLKYLNYIPNWSNRVHAVLAASASSGK